MSSQTKGQLKVETFQATSVNEATEWLTVVGGEATVSIVDGGSMDMTIVLEVETHDTDESNDLRVETAKTYTGTTFEVFQAAEPCRIRLRVSVDTAGQANLRVAAISPGHIAA